MRRLLHVRAMATLLAAGLLVLGRPAAAQSGASFGLAAGATIPSSSYANDKNTGYHLGVVLNLHTPVPPIGFRVDGSFTEMKYKGSSTKEQLWIANANLVLRPPGALVMTPYAIGGVGIYNGRRNFFLANSRASTGFGFNVGGGLRFGVGDAHTFLEVRYHAANDRNHIRLIPITFGVSF